jgi:hypothetical protein
MKYKDFRKRKFPCPYCGQVYVMVSSQCRWCGKWITRKSKNMDFWKVPVQAKGVNVESSEKIKKLIADFKDEKIKWWELAPHMVDIKHFDEYAQRQILQSVIRSYLFIKKHAPNWFDNPKDISHYTVAYLPFIYMKLVENKRIDEFKPLVDGVLAGTIAATEVRKLSKELKSPRPNQNSPEKKDPPSVSSDEEAILGLLNALDYMLNNSKTPIEQLRERIGSRCYSTANRLQCVADEEFNELWNNRKEFTI